MSEVALPRQGDTITNWRDHLVFVQGACQRGNVFIFVANVSPPGQPHTYRLCGCWLDSHFSVAGLKPPVHAGRAFETAYTVAVWGDQRLTRAQAVDIARASIRAGDLVFPAGP